MIELLSSQAFWIGLMKIIWIDLLLSGDNAVVIALASRSLPPHQQRKAILYGTGAAILLRTILTVFAVALLALPYLKIVGGLLLVWIGVKLLVPEEGEESVATHDNLIAAIRTILIADLVMSLDNVLAVAAAADTAPGPAKLPLLILGLAISIPIMIFGSKFVLRLMERLPFIITLGAALLGWIAGEMIVTDPALVGWVNQNAEWLHSYRVMAVIGAVVVVVVGALASRSHGAKEARVG
jgi:YjbE family integral membrane protein